MKKNLFASLAVVLVLFVVLGIFIYRGNHSENAYEQTLIAYLDAMKEGSSKAIAYTAFPNEVIEHDYLSSPVCITDYKIISSSQVNDNLFAFALEVATTDTPAAYRSLYYFVGQQNDEYTVYINVDYVPEALSANLDPNDYSYSNPDDLDAFPEFDS